MKWQEVRELFPDQFVLVSIIHYHEEDNKKNRRCGCTNSHRIRRRCE